MESFVSIIHVIVAVALIGLVLVQDSKGGGALGIGGGSNSLLGATGAQTLAEKLTKIVATLFAITAITLGYLGSQSQKSVLDGAVLPSAPSQSAPGTPGTDKASESVKEGSTTTNGAAATAPNSNGSPAKGSAPSNKAETTPPEGQAPANK